MKALSSIVTLLFNVNDINDLPLKAEFSIKSIVVPVPIINSRNGNVAKAFEPILFIQSPSSMNTLEMFGADPKHSAVIFTKTSGT